MAEATLIFPHQLFEDHPGLSRRRPIYLIEEQWFFRDPETQLKYHRQKLLLHRASLQAYRDLLAKRGYVVHYLEYTPDLNMAYLFERLKKDGVATLFACEVVERGLTARLIRGAAANDVKIQFLATPMFLCSEEDIIAFFGKRQRFHQTSFYIRQRRRHQILIEKARPAGGRWTYDSMNRRRLPRDVKVPPLPTPEAGPYVSEAREYISRNFPDHQGDKAPFIYPVTHEAAQRWLEDFLVHRLANFGLYQDAISAREPYLFHSLLSPLLNIGLLTPHQVLEATLAFVQEHSVPLNSLEGFVRQILGWREYVRAVYFMVGEQQRTGNFWGHHRSLPTSFYTGDTGIPPVDTVIRRLLATAYAHHIERLMILGNFMLLTEIAPRVVYQWFMEMFIDAYDWVMVPNVFGMSQFADGGLMMTKPYLSSSRYLLRMSDYEAGPWCDLWDGLFWRFIDKHRSYCQNNPRLKPLLRTMNQLPPARLSHLLQIARDYLEGGGREKNSDMMT